MAASIQQGRYELSLEQRGIRMSRGGDTPRVMVRPVLSFFLTEAGNGPVPFMLHRTVPLPNGGVQVTGYHTDRVILTVDITPAEGMDALQVEAKVENASADMQIRLGVVLSLSGEAEPRWMVPGFFYGDNRPPGCTRAHPSFSEMNRDPRRLISNQWSFRSDRAAVPLVCGWTYGCFAFVATEETFGRSSGHPRGIGMSGLQFGCDDGQPYVGAEFPYSEAPAKFSFCHEDKTEPEEMLTYLPVNTPLRVAFQVGFGTADLHSYNDVVRALYRRFEQEHPQKPTLPAEAAEQMAHSGLLRWHYEGRQGAIYQLSSFDRQIGKRRGAEDPPTMHAGWAGGLLPAYTLLRSGRESNHPESITAGTAVINKFSSQLSPIGTIFPVWSEDAGWACSFGAEDGTAHSRTVAEAVYFMLRAVMLEMRHNTNHPSWCEAALSSITYAMGSQREDGCFPAYFDLSTGRPTTYEGVGGMPWIAAFAVAAMLMQKPHYREVAQRGGQYYAQFVLTENLYGTVEDQPLTPTADDCHWALITYMALYDLDRDVKWLDLARRAADLALTWRMTCNTQFHPESMLGRYHVKTRGGDIASVGTPYVGPSGLISYAEMMKLGTFIADTYYRERAEDARHFATQLIAPVDGYLNARSGMVAGQIYHTDWIQPKGMVASTSNVMAAASVKLAEVMRRQMRLTRAATAPMSLTDVVSGAGNKPVYYADFAFQRESAADVPVAMAALGDVTSSVAGMLGLPGNAMSPRRPAAPTPPPQRPARPLGPQLTPFPAHYQTQYSEDAIPLPRPLTPAPGGPLGRPHTPPPAGPKAPAFQPSAVPPPPMAPAASIAAVRRPSAMELSAQIPAPTQIPFAPVPLSPAASVARRDSESRILPGIRTNPVTYEKEDSKVEMSRALTNAIGSSLGLSPLPAGRGRMNSRSSGDAVPKLPAGPPPAQNQVPQPPQPAPFAMPEASEFHLGDGDDDVEIKYKIF